MAKMPKEWRVYVRGNLEGEFRLFKPSLKRSKTAEAWHRRIGLGHSSMRDYALWGLILVGAAALGWRMLSLEAVPPPPHPSAWPAEIRARHQAAARSCDAARAAGLAPATRGYPGYWPHHDRDNDGVSCEWSLGAPGITLHTLRGGE
jgi:hypothetical protein